MLPIAYFAATSSAGLPSGCLQRSFTRIVHEFPAINYRLDPPGGLL